MSKDGTKRGKRNKSATAKDAAKVEKEFGKLLGNIPKLSLPKSAGKAFTLKKKKKGSGKVAARAKSKTRG